MVRCEQFYEYWEKKGNFCNKSENVVKQIEEYIDYVKRNKIVEYGGFRISNCALDPFINIENEKNGKVHKFAIRELKSLIRKDKIKPEKITRRVSIELINKANLKVEEGYKLKKIPNIRSRMGEFEHEINEVGFEVRNMFDAFKNDIGAKNNNEALKIMLEACVRDIEGVRQIKEELDKKKEYDDVEVVKNI